MRPRRQSGRMLKRSTANRAELRTIVVFTEGKSSEPDYVNGLKKLPTVAGNAALNIEIHPRQGAPITLVEMAVERKEGDVEVDEYWCLFDVEWPEHHPSLAKALDLARANGIRVAVSNPCFEIWLILHHQVYTGFIDTKGAQRVSRAHDKRAGKSIDAAAYMPMRKDAARRARALEKGHREAGTLFPHDNPSSGMFRFLEAVEGDARTDGTTHR